MLLLIALVDLGQTVRPVFTPSRMVANLRPALRMPAPEWLWNSHVCESYGFGVVVTSDVH